MSIRACKALNIEGMARVDFFYEEKFDKIWINEINSLPGFTSQSMFPMLWKASGLTIEHLLHELLEIAKK